MKAIAALVILVHGLGIWGLYLYYRPNPVSINPQKVIVHTVAFKQASEKMAEAPPSQPKPKPKPAKKPALSNEQKQKLQKARQALNAVNKTPHAKIHMEPLTLAGEQDYTSGLAKALQSMVTLPEYGPVNIQISLDRSGKVTKISVLESESSLNQKTVERILKKAKFPAFGSNFSGEKIHTFDIVLRNDF